MKNLFILMLTSILVSFCGKSPQNPQAGDVYPANTEVGITDANEEETVTPVSIERERQEEEKDTAKVIAEAMDVYKKIVSDAQSKDDKFAQEVEEAAKRFMVRMAEFEAMEKHIVDTIASLEGIIENGQDLQTRMEDAANKIMSLGDGKESSLPSTSNPDLDRVNANILSAARGEHKTFALELQDAIAQFGERIVEIEQIVVSMEYTLAELRNTLSEAKEAQRLAQDAITQS